MTRAAVLLLALTLSGCMSATDDGLPVIQAPGYQMVIRDSELRFGGNLSEKSASVGVKIRWGKSK